MKTKLGISAGALAAIAYLTGFFSGYLVLVLIVGYVFRIVLLRKYGLKGLKFDGSQKSMFYISCAIISIATFIPASFYISFRDFTYAFFNTISAILIFIGYFFLAKFYINDFTFRDIEAEEKVAAQSQTVSETQVTPEN